MQNPDNQTTSIADHPKPFTKPVGDKQLTNEQQRSVSSGTRKRNDWALKLYEECSKQSLIICNQLSMVNYETSIKWPITKYDSSDFYLPQIHECTTAAVATATVRNTLYLKL